MPALDVADLGTILSVWAHPDDEGYCCGTIMANAVRNGQRVVCVTATRGERGSTDESRWPNGPELAAVRTQELAAALAIFGVTEHEYFDYPDGGCADIDPDQAVARLRAVIDEVRPDTVLTFGPDGGTVHPDHSAVSRWVSAATAGTSIRVLHTVTTPEWQATVDELVPRELVMMEDKEPVNVPAAECDLYVEIGGADLEQKYRAMLCMESQIGPLLALGGIETYHALLHEEAFVMAVR